MTFTVVDLNSDASPDQIDAFKSLIRRISEERSDLLWENYKKLVERFGRYDAFHCLFSQGGEITGFAALQSHFCPDGFSRALTRSYIAPEFRSSNRFPPTGSRSFLSDLVLPRQVDVAVKLGKKGVFVSFEKPSRRPFIERWIAHLNDLYPGKQWTLLPDMYLTYPQPEKASCWQLVAFLPLDGYDAPPLESISAREWHSRFGDANG
jgi:hypothetical protein